MTALAPITLHSPASVRRAAARNGLGAGLRELSCLLPADAVVCGASGWALVTEEALDSADAVAIGDRLYRRCHTVLVSQRTDALTGEGVVAVRVTPLRRARPEPAHGVTDVLAIGAGQLRLGLSVALLNAAQVHLAGRASGGSSLLQQPSVRSALAEAALEQLLARRQLEAPTCDVRSAGRAHARITRAGRCLLGLLGASGFLLNGPGRAAHVSELLANAVAGGGLDEEESP
jgi:hypothetical protein